MADTYSQQADLNVGATGTGALTLAQAALLETDTLKKGVVEVFIDENPLLKRLPWQEISGNSLAYDYEVSLPGVGFRAVNEGYSTQHGRVGQRSVTLAIFGGDLDVDRFIMKTRSSVNDQRAIQEAMQLKAMSKTFQKYFFDGDRTTSGDEEFDGVNLLLQDTYHAAAGAAGRDMDGVPISTTDDNGWDANGSGYLAKLVDVLDAAIDDVIGGSRNKVILMNKTVRRWLTKLARNDGQVTIGKDEWGYQVWSYAGCPILEIEDDASGDDILAFDETCGSATSATCSFYVCRFEPGYLTGLQNGGMDVRDLGELQGLSTWRTRVEWFCALALMHPRAVRRVIGLHQYT
jgi:hypothetical protein